MAETQFDMAVVGGGPGGYVAAIRAKQLGMNVALVEREHLGGICLNWGCIPTKALLRSAEVGHLIARAAEFGWQVEGARFDLDAMVKRSRSVAKQLSNGVGFLLKKNKIPVFEGSAAIAGPGQLRVTQDGKAERLLQAKSIILATGARARALPGLEPDGALIWSYKEAMVPPSIPKSLLIVGSGAIGIEFASFYNDLGVSVTVVEVMDRILPAEDEEISALARKLLEKQGIVIKTGAKVTQIDKHKDQVTAQIESAAGTETLDAARVISAVGIVGNVEGLGLENTAVKVERGHVLVDAFSQTHAPGIYAIGDLTGAPWLAHKASHEGIICVEKIAGLDPHPLDVTRIPGCTYARPQVASIGLSEAKAKAAGHEIRVGRFPFIGNGKAIALGEPEGLIKTIFDAKTGELLGAHMIGAEVTEMIQGYAIGMTLETTETELMNSVFPHPTLTEMMHESVLAAYGRSIHI